MRLEREDGSRGRIKGEGEPKAGAESLSDLLAEDEGIMDARHEPNLALAKRMRGASIPAARLKLRPLRLIVSSRVPVIFGGLLRVIG